MMRLTGTDTSYSKPHVCVWRNVIRLLIHAQTLPKWPTALLSSFSSFLSVFTSPYSFVFFPLPLSFLIHPPGKESGFPYKVCWKCNPFTFLVFRTGSRRIWDLVPHFPLQLQGQGRKWGVCVHVCTQAHTQFLSKHWRLPLLLPRGVFLTTWPLGTGTTQALTLFSTPCQCSCCPLLYCRTPQTQL